MNLVSQGNEQLLSQNQARIAFQEHAPAHTPSIAQQDSMIRGLHRHSSNILPEVGQTRCYWTLLSSSLRFLVLDPVLAYHLQGQATAFLGTSLLDFVHPEERQSAHQDLGGVLEERTLHGTVTRVRYCRLSRVRRLLGFEPSSGTPPYPPTFPAERIAIDSHYMAVDIVLNWAAEGLLLCFIHAVVDLAPREDNDEVSKTGWSNWCSTYGFGDQQAQTMYGRLCECIPPLSIQDSHSSDSSLRVLQILRNRPERSLMLSWPPEDSIIRSNYLSPSAQELARLAQHVEIGSIGAGNYGEAKTSCTRRFKSIQSLIVSPRSDSEHVQVESIFVPHGTIMFACHKIDMPALSRDINEGKLSTQSQLLPHHDPLYPYLPEDQNQYHLHYAPDVSCGIPYLTSSPHSELPTDGYVQQWVEGQSLHPRGRHPQMLEQNYNRLYEQRLSPISPSESHSYVEMGLKGESQQQWQNSDLSPSSPRMLTPSSTELQQLNPIEHQTSSSGTAASSLDDDHEVRSSAPLPKTMTGHCKSPSTLRDVISKSSYAGGDGSASKHAGNPPVGILRCASCKSTHSPEWRKGPTGKKDLCNACGLRFARSRAKKEGMTSRKRKDKSQIASKHSASASVSAASDTTSGSSPSTSACLCIKSKEHGGSCVAPASKIAEYHQSIRAPQSAGTRGSLFIKAEPYLYMPTSSPSPPPREATPHLGYPTDRRYRQGVDAERSLIPIDSYSASRLDTYPSVLDNELRHDMDADDAVVGQHIPLPHINSEEADNQVFAAGLPEPVPSRDERAADHSSASARNPEPALPLPSEISHTPMSINVHAMVKRMPPKHTIDV